MARRTCLGRQADDCTASYHGTASAYHRGCRCPHAREDHRLYNKRRRQGRGQPRWIDPTGTRRRMMALAAIGWPLATQTGMIGWNTAAGRLMWGSSRVTRRVADQIANLYEQLKDTPGPSSVSRSRAARKGWPTPAEWDLGGDIDDPTADARPEPTATLDVVAVEQALEGQVVDLTSLERHHAVHVGRGKGLSLTVLADRLGMSRGVVRGLERKPLSAGYELVA